MFSRTSRERGVRAYFLRLFSQIALFSLLLNAGLSVLLYANYRSYSLDVLHRAHQRMLVPLRDNLEQVSRYALAFAVSLFNDADAAALMYPDSPAAYDTVTAIMELDRLIQGVPFIHSAYLYNGKTGQYYALGPNRSVRDRQHFFDRGISTILDSMQGGTTTVPISRSIPASELEAEPMEDVFTYVIADRRSDTGVVTNAAVVNVKLDWIYSSLEPGGGTIDAETVGSILLVDSSGAVQGRASGGSSGTGVPPTRSVDRILASGSTSGFLVSDDRGAKALISYVYIESLDWYMLGMTPYSYIAASLIRVQNVTFIIFLAFASVAIFAAFLLSRQLYAPIGALWRRTARRIEEPEALDRRDEIALIDDYVSKTARRVSALEGFRKENLAELKQETLRSLLRGAYDGHRTKERLRALDIPLADGDRILLVLFRTDHYATLCRSLDEGERGIRKLALARVGLEVFRREWACEAVDTGRGSLTFLIWRAASGPAIPVAAVLPLVEEVKGSYSRLFHESVSAFVGDAVSRLRDVRGSYGGLVHLSRYRITRTAACTLTEETLRGARFGRFDLDHPAVVGLLEALKLGTMDSACAHLETILEVLRSCEYNTIMCSLSYLTASVFHTLSLIERNGPVAFGVDFPSFEKRLSIQDTLEDVGAEYRRLFAEVVAKRNHRKESGSEEVVRGVDRYIEENYAAKALCTRLVADSMSLSAPYVSKLYREARSQSIADRIREVRLQRARELLQQGSLRVREVIECVGWENSKYFYRVFKSHFGVTPTELRRKARAARPGPIAGGSPTYAPLGGDATGP